MYDYSDNDIIMVFELMDIIRVSIKVAYHLLNSDKIKAFRIGWVGKFQKAHPMNL